MDGLTWLDLAGFRILRADYGVAKDPIQLMHATKQEQYLTKEYWVYCLVDFALKPFSESFVDEYRETSRNLLSEKKIVAAYIGLIPELFEAAKGIIERLDPARAQVEFFETEPAALAWLISFKSC